ncbi:organophosphate reductase [Neocallimastix lanati (nom. inval.)]|jgi:diketogulonate reductase-like aldo/keto reductase|uniref:Organophosphate reductase n=1 Tax=Neocallimastix californiae TaxID=1754190 RepID=A0A1Y2B433_9FUNG|nr:organophosphate reductase [Neocallimastix sp. JGI-2020a]ORY29592.1 organophosphate reductase [Neocallimastix californiae]|eukprot:ORY29592.1 organophosphate reductase [Neocallimastix californiae]
MEYKTLSNGLKIPMLGFGVYQIPPNQTKECVLAALRAGYRLIDTAQAYKNEKAVGEAIRESGIPREEIFITTKLWISSFSYEGVQEATERSLEALGVDYIDLMLLHQPMGDYIGAWRGLEKLYKEGKLKSIGVSNFYPHVITDICETVEIKPMVNQVETHPFFQQTRNLLIMKNYGVAPEAWGPFNEGKNNFFTNPILKEIGEKYGKSAAQVSLRWNIQRGVIVIPKSVHEDRIKENFNVFDFKLNDEDMKKISTMDIGHSEIVDHFDPNFVKLLHSFNI